MTNLTAQRPMTTRDIMFSIALAATSGAAILAHTFGPVPMILSVPFIVMPTVAVLMGAMLLRRRLHDRYRAFANVVWAGAWTGLLATVAYDLIRPVIARMFHFQFDPFRAIRVFGMLITGLTVTDPTAIAAGWAYHFWNGISFGMMFALVKPGGGVFAGLLWGLGLECLMLLTYPHLLQIRLDDPGFLTTGLVGHSLWGVILGACVAKWGPHA